MLAKGTDEIIGEVVTLVYIAADCAHIAFFSGCLGLGLNVLVIVVVGEGRDVTKLCCFCDFGDIESV